MTKPVLDENKNVILQFTPDEWKEREAARAVVRRESKFIEGQIDHAADSLMISSKKFCDSIDFFAAVKLLAGEGE